MAPYHHQQNTHHRVRFARKFKRFAQISVVVAVIFAGYLGVDRILASINERQTVVSTESNATVQSAQINIFQTPYFRFQADSNWREVTDELNLANVAAGSHQYLYRGFEGNFIEHELWVTVNLPQDYILERHNIPTRVLPVRIEPDGTLTVTNSVSETCFDSLPDPEKSNVAPRTLTQEEITYYCDPNNVNNYTVAVGVPGGTTRLLMPQSDGESVEVTITYRNVTATPEARQLRSILSTFRSL